MALRRERFLPDSVVGPLLWGHCGDWLRPGEV